MHAARLERPAEVLGLLLGMGVEPRCLRLTAGGHPEHPLRLPLGCGLVRFEREVGKADNATSTWSQPWPNSSLRCCSALHHSACS